ncbi:molecular chaperone DnaJ [Aestuariivivens marinum]|uniref:molecular chaperone DnaJ n=1 Tax=Aestuariivivens marinum TaxID=2913555 RepID=UPI001F586AE2|nr:molecular chaperone DnaJ [Aestuariivivens marinum]
MQIRDSLVIEEVSQIGDTLTNTTNGSYSLWFWIALLELTFIIVLIFRLKKKQSKLPLSEISKRDIKGKPTTQIDMDNLMNSINGARDLYKVLSRACHPDKFIGSEKHQISEELFQEITKNKRNYGRLQELKNQAQESLNINFKD